MSNVANATNHSDEILNMFTSARRQASVAIKVPEAGLYHRAMSRRKSLAEDDLMNAFTLPPIPLDSDVESSDSDEESTSSSSESSDSSPEPPKPDVSLPDRIIFTPDPTPIPLNLATTPTYPPSVLPDPVYVSSDSSSPEVVRTKSAKKISFLKKRSASAHLLNVQSRVGRMGRRLSLNNAMKNIKEERAAATTNKNGVSSRRSSLPTIIPKLSPSLDVKESLPEDDETANSISSDQEEEKPKNTKEELLKKRLEAPTDEKERKLSQRLEEEQIDSKESKPTIYKEMSNEERKRRKTVKDVFKKSIFKSRRTVKRDQQTSPTSSKRPDPRKLFQRRPSQLDMGMPIEEVFSGIKFKKVEKKSPVIAPKDPDEEEEADKREEKSPDDDQRNLHEDFASLATSGGNNDRDDSEND